MSDREEKDDKDEEEVSMLMSQCKNKSLENVSEHCTGAVQSPTISSICNSPLRPLSNNENSNSSPPGPSSRSRHSSMSGDHWVTPTLRKELAAALEQNAKLEERIKKLLAEIDEKDERIRILEEEHQRQFNAAAGFILSSPEPAPKRVRRPKRPKKVKKFIDDYDEDEFFHSFSPVSNEQAGPSTSVSLPSKMYRTQHKSRTYDILSGPPPTSNLKFERGISTTRVPYYRNIYSSADASIVMSTEKPQVPTWRVNEIKSDEEDDEPATDPEEDDLSDSVFLKRHEKAEEQERAIIKKDQSYQREQFYYSRLKKSTMPDPKSVKTLYPSFDEIEKISVTKSLPLSIWGSNLPKLVEQPFSLPWLTTMEEVKAKTSSTLT
ncbi:Oidioi.mRNA.OKI2018_I69.chr1.g1723.t1.cds [Oikopleura dioica]|uniref:Oidioi.mRNA.OKI2018_I69.chr1.g1723.t1.cds n=1 Tax=Oikopleura dioica TaxID=34765 RepID=A0ABN7SSA1_OIKDI|nr:Oidioi.mRNA.OKI2018_I69.chr1.g1723.t1.cds [Oikopleura dioica]